MTFQLGNPYGRPAHPETTCSVDGCDRHDICRGWCARHYNTWKRCGVPTAAKTTWTPNPKGNPSSLPVMKGAANPRYGGNVVKYGGAHQRVVAAFGSASIHQCVDCGGCADDWSYNHKDPNEQISVKGAYSPDYRYYEARCTPCHAKFDATARAVS